MLTGTALGSRPEAGGADAALAKEAELQGGPVAAADTRGSGPVTSASLVLVARVAARPLLRHGTWAAGGTAGDGTTPRLPGGSLNPSEVPSATERVRLARGHTQPLELPVPGQRPRVS